MQSRLVATLALFALANGYEHNTSFEMMEPMEPLELDAVANPDQARGHTFFVAAWSAAARHNYCYQIQVGGQMLQNPNPVPNANVPCQAYMAQRHISIGHYANTVNNMQNYVNGDAAGCPGRPRTSSLVMHVGNHPSVTATVSEPTTCHYVVTLTGPAAQLGVRPPAPPPPPPPPPRVDCLGHFNSGPCHCSHVQTYQVTRAARNGGRACPHATGFRQNGACHGMAMSLATEVDALDRQPESTEKWTFASGIVIGFGAGLMMAASIAAGLRRTQRSAAITPDTLLG